MSHWNEQKITKVTTAKDLTQTLKALGVTATDTLFVHTKLSAFGFIPGGEEGVVVALKQTVPQGNVMMNTQTSDFSDPKEWGYPPADPKTWATIREAMPAYDPQTTPVHMIGKTPEFFRTQPDTVRSDHPLYSFAAWGGDAYALTSDHALDLPFGSTSPLAKFVAKEGKIVFLGTDYETCTLLHLAESLIDRPTITEWAKIKQGGEEEWVAFQNVDLEPYDDFADCGAAFEQAHPQAIRTADVQGTIVKVIDSQPLIDFATAYYRKKDQDNY
ncbi:MAG: AAC(3) family N-acetyltransferase [Aerococcus sp.]|nr:AAC(3) family N-acetyltransferase [Aerococcus sp.]